MWEWAESSVPPPGTPLSWHLCKFTNLESTIWPSFQTTVWEKLNPRPAQGKNITNSFEYIICIGNEELKSNQTYTKNIIQTSVNSDMPEEHKAVMHPFVADWFIYNFTQEKSVVLDPFMGTGTTAVSCAKYGREYIGFEIL